jgi:hypothetical protein
MLPRRQFLLIQIQPANHGDAAGERMGQMLRHCVERPELPGEHVPPLILRFLHFLDEDLSDYGNNTTILE